MNLHEKIADIVDEELNERLVSMMNEYIEIISKKHGISMDLLLKDIPETFSGTIWKGTKRMEGGVRSGVFMVGIVDTTRHREIV
jgi:hypothetical protein